MERAWRLLNTTGNTLPDHSVGIHGLGKTAVGDFTPLIEKMEPTRWLTGKKGLRGGLTVWDPEDPDCVKNEKAFGLSHLKRVGEVVIAGRALDRIHGKRVKHESNDGGSCTFTRLHGDAKCLSRLQPPGTADRVQSIRSGFGSNRGTRSGAVSGPKGLS